VRIAKPALVLLVLGLVGASALAQVERSGGVSVQAPGVVVPAPTPVAVFPDVVETGTNTVRRAPPRHVTDAHPYGDAPAGAAPSEVRLESAIDVSNPYAFNGSGAALLERVLPHVVAFRELDSENSYGAGLAAVEHAPIDSENPYGKR
jgi:hypothetical protein